MKKLILFLFLAPLLGGCASQLPVGSVLMSTNSESDFRSKNGEVWVLLRERVPESSGAFPKISDSEANIGEVSPSNVGLHSHSLQFVMDDGGRVGEPYTPGVLTPRRGYGKFKDYKKDGAHDVMIDGPQGETEPKNIRLNFFIKTQTCSAVSTRCL